VWLDALFGGRSAHEQGLALCVAGADRRISGDSDVSTVVDSLTEGHVSVAMHRITMRRPAESAVGVHGTYALVKVDAGGWLLVSDDDRRPEFWLPRSPVARQVSANGHVMGEAPAELRALATIGTGLQAKFYAIEGSVLDIVAWRFSGSSDRHLQRELSHSTPLEAQAWYLWGTHDIYTKPADLYAHMIHGGIYEARYAWPYRRKICSENDAHALYVTLAGLQRATGKRLYALLRQHLLLSVIARQSPDGGFRHGEWTDGMESHYRLHCSAMHLMMDALAERDDPRIRDALTAAASFLAVQHERLPSGAWFLHDELEHSVEALARGPFKWIESRAFGKSKSNMLVLNTHLDATIALDRYCEVTGDRRHVALVESAKTAARTVLAARPAEMLYRLIFALLAPSFLPAAEAKGLPIWKRALKRLATEYLVPLLPKLKARFPRIVMPNGYIDRELSLKTFAHDYQSINLMDLARYTRRFGDDIAREALFAGLRFCRASGILRRWKEHAYQRYALGFWAEALYHVCQLTTQTEYRAWLAEAILDLEDLGMGLPPSLLGANAEAVHPAGQIACPATSDPRLRVANLSRAGRVEFVVVNPSTEEIALAWGQSMPSKLACYGADGAALARSRIIVPARAWVTALSMTDTPSHT